MKQIFIHVTFFITSFLIKKNLEKKEKQE